MNLSLHLQDLVRGTRIVKTKKELDKSDLWSREQLDAYQLKKLQKLVSFSYQHVPYYRELFDNIGLKPDDIRELADIQKIPISTKEMIRKGKDNLIADNVNVNSYKIKRAVTGGTTGIPFAFYKDTQTRDFSWGAYYRWHDWMGIKNRDRKAVLWSSGAVIEHTWVQKCKSKIINKLSKILHLNAYGLNDEYLQYVAKQLIKFKPTLIHGYLSAILQVAKYFKDNNLTLPSLRAISSTTETLLPMYREYIEGTFGVKMFDQYGGGECNSMAFECSAHMGLHITEEHCLLEILDDSNNLCYGKPGRVILTDLDNYAFPFIRYENGDSAIMSQKQCDCGRHSKLLESISGRTADVFYIKDDIPVTAAFFVSMFLELYSDWFEHFTRFQVYQKKKGELIFRLEKADKNKEYPESGRIEFLKHLQTLGDNVELEILDNLPYDKSGKFRYVVSEVKE